MSLADDSVRSAPASAPADVESTSTVVVGETTVAFTPSPFFFLPNETPKLLAKLARVPLAVITVDEPAKGDVRGIW